MGTPPWFEHSLTVCAVVLGFVLVRTVRREARGRGYAVFVAGLLAVTIAAIVQGSRFLGVIALALSAIGVYLPWAIELGVRVAFGRGRLALAVRLSGLRALLMPGAGLGRQQEILRGLAMLEDGGVDKALAHFRGLADDADEGEAMLIHEQIVSMLFYGQRWDEGIAHYEARFHPRYAALRPALALGLLRAYGESGRLDTAAGLLRALEDGPVGADPRALGFISQARLTFLAYAGASQPVRAALTEERRRVLGLSPASSALLRGIALARAGEPAAAAVELERVPTLAEAADDRIVDASRASLARVDDGAVELPPELGRYVDAVAQRLEAFLQAAPRLRRARAAWLAPLVAIVIVLVETTRFVLERGGLGLLELGAFTPELWTAGSWGRATVGAFLAGDPLLAFVDAYAVWSGGSFIERVVGRGRFALLGLGAAALGMIAAAVLDPTGTYPISGASLFAAAIVGGALLLLPRSRTPGLPASARRGLAVPLGCVLAVLLLAGGGGLFALAVPWAGLWVAAVWAVLVVGLLPALGRFAGGLGVLGILLALPVGLGVLQVSREDPEAFLVARRVDVRDDAGAVLRLPSTFAATEPTNDPSLPLPLMHGHADSLAARAGDLVQVVVGERADAGTPLPLALDKALRHQIDAVAVDVPPALARRFSVLGGDVTTLRAWLLRRNGVDVGIVVERDLDATHTVALVAAPVAALDRGRGVYASILYDARAR